MFWTFFFGYVLVEDSIDMPIHTACHALILTLHAIHTAYHGLTLTLVTE
jgi:hypothetical protein